MVRSLLVTSAVMVALLPVGAAAQVDRTMMGMAGGWRMPPMEYEMPMLPGMAGIVPVVGPYLPGMGVDIATLHANLLTLCHDLLPQARVLIGA